MTDTNTTITTNEAFRIAQATVTGVLNEIKDEIKVLADIYDSRDLFGIAYMRFAEKINDIIDEHIEM